MGVNGIYGLSGSGLDVESMVKVGMLGKQSEYDKMQQTYTKNEWKKAEYVDLYSEVQTFNNSTVSNFKMSGTTNARQAASTNENAVIATANANAPTMTHYVEVGQLATSAYLVSNNTVKADKQTSVYLVDKLFNSLTQMEGDGNAEKVLVKATSTSTAVQKDKDDIALAFTISDGTNSTEKDTDVLVTSNANIVTVDANNRAANADPVDSLVIQVHSMATVAKLTLSLGSNYNSNTTISEFFFGTTKDTNSTYKDSSDATQTKDFDAETYKLYLDRLSEQGTNTDTTTAITFKVSTDGKVTQKNINFTYKELTDTATKFQTAFQEKLDVFYKEAGAASGTVQVSINNGELSIFNTATGNDSKIDLEINAVDFGIGKNYNLVSHPEDLKSASKTWLNNSTTAYDFFIKLFAGDEATDEVINNYKTAVDALKDDPDKKDNPAFAITVGDGLNTKTISIKYSDFDTTLIGNKLTTLFENNSLSTLSASVEAVDANHGRIVIHNSGAGSDSKISFSVDASTFAIGNANNSSTSPESIRSKGFSDQVASDDKIGKLMYQIFDDGSGKITDDQYNKYMVNFKGDTNTAFTLNLSDGTNDPDPISITFDYLANTGTTVAEFITYMNEQLSTKGSNIHIDTDTLYTTGGYLSFKNTEIGESATVSLKINENINLGNSTYKLGTYSAELFAASNTAATSAGAGVTVKDLFKNLFGSDYADYDKAIARLATEHPNDTAFSITFSDGTTSKAVDFKYSDLIADAANTSTFVEKINSTLDSASVKINATFDTTEKKLKFVNTEVGHKLSYNISAFNLGRDVTGYEFGIAPADLSTATISGLKENTTIAQWFAALSTSDVFSTPATDFEALDDNVTDPSDSVFTLKVNDGTNTALINFTYADLKDNSTKLLSKINYALSSNNVRAKIEHDQLIFYNETLGSQINYSLDYTNSKLSDYTLGTKATASGGTNIFGTTVNDFGNIFDTTQNITVNSTVIVTSTTIDGTSTLPEGQTREAITNAYQYTTQNGTFTTTNSSITVSPHMENIQTETGYYQYTIGGQTVFYQGTSLTGTPEMTSTEVASTDSLGNAWYNYQMTINGVTQNVQSTESNITPIPIYSYTIPNVTANITSTATQLTDTVSTQTIYEFNYGNVSYTSTSSTDLNYSGSTDVYKYSDFGNFETTASSLSPTSTDTIYVFEYNGETVEKTNDNTSFQAVSTWNTNTNKWRHVFSEFNNYILENDSNVATLAPNKDNKYTYHYNYNGVEKTNTTGENWTWSASETHYSFTDLPGYTDTSTTLSSNANHPVYTHSYTTESGSYSYTDTKSSQSNLAGTATGQNYYTINGDTYGPASSYTKNNVTTTTTTETGKYIFTGLKDANGDSLGSITDTTQTHTSNVKQYKTTTQQARDINGNAIYEFTDESNQKATTTSSPFSTSQLYKLSTNTPTTVTLSQAEYLKEFSSTATAFTIQLNDGNGNSGTKIDITYGDLLGSNTWTAVGNRIINSIISSVNIKVEWDGDKLKYTHGTAGSGEKINVTISNFQNGANNGLTAESLGKITTQLFGKSIKANGTTDIVSTAGTTVDTDTIKTNLANFWNVPSEVSKGSFGYTSATLKSKLNTFLGGDSSFNRTASPAGTTSPLTNTDVSKNIASFLSNGTAELSTDATPYYYTETNYGITIGGSKDLATKLANFLSSGVNENPSGVYNYSSTGGYTGPSNSDLALAMATALGISNANGTYSYSSDATGAMATISIMDKDGNYVKATYNAETGKYVADESGEPISNVTLSTNTLTYDDVTYGFHNEGKVVTAYIDEPQTIEITYGDLLNKFTFNDLVAKINNAGTNIRATYDSVQDRLSIYNRETGSRNEIRLTMLDQNAADFFTSLDLRQSSYGSLADPENADPADPSQWNSNFEVNATSILTGKDAIAKIDGIDYTDLSANAVTVNGVTYNFKGVTSSLNEDKTAVASNSAATSAVSVSITQDSSKIAENVKSFVEKYNSILEKLYEWYTEKPNSDYKPLTASQKEAMKEEQIEKWEEKAKAGLLYHDSALGNLITEIRSSISGTVSGVNSKYNSIFALGISTTGSQGQLKIDEDKLNAAIAADPDAVYNIFSKLDDGQTYYRLKNKTTGEYTWSTTEARNGWEPDRDKDGNTVTKKVERTAFNGVAQRLSDVLTKGLKNIKSVAGTTTEISEDSELNNLLRELQTRMSNFQTMMKAFESRLYKKYDAMESSLALLGSQLNYVMSAFGGQ